MRKQIKNLWVIFSVDKLWTCTEVIKKKINKAVFKDKFMQFFVNIFDSTEVLESLTLHSWNFNRVLKVKDCLKYDSQITTLFDTGV